MPSLTSRASKIHEKRDVTQKSMIAKVSTTIVGSAILISFLSLHYTLSNVKVCLLVFSTPGTNFSDFKPFHPIVPLFWPRKPAHSTHGGVLPSSYAATLRPAMCAVFMVFYVQYLIVTQQFVPIVDTVPPISLDFCNFHQLSLWLKW